MEAWLALGLRLEWAASYTQIASTEWMGDDEEKASYYYEGFGVWRVLERHNRMPGYPSPRAPQMGNESMRHELAHYLIATDEQREQRNFGLTGADTNTEAQTLGAERIIDAMINACDRIAALALKGPTA